MCIHLTRGTQEIVREPFSILKSILVLRRGLQGDVIVVETEFQSRSLLSPSASVKL